MAESKTEARVRERERMLAATTAEMNHLSKFVDEMRKAMAESDRLIADLRQENAVLRQKQEESDGRVDKLEARSWWRITTLVAALLSLAAGLIVTLVRR